MSVLGPYARMALRWTLEAQHSCLGRGLEGRNIVFHMVAKAWQADSIHIYVRAALLACKSRAHFIACYVIACEFVAWHGLICKLREYPYRVRGSLKFF